MLNYPLYDSLDEGPEPVKRRYELRVFDDENEEEVYTDHWYSEESMLEDLRKVDQAFDQHEQELAEDQAEEAGERDDLPGKLYD